MYKLVKDLSGQKFGRLTVIKFAYVKKHRYCWLCKCECGNEKIVIGHSLKDGRTKSCGCLRKEKAKYNCCTHGKYNCCTHGMSATTFYHLWRTMKQRCNNKNNKKYKHYGGRGITISKEWLKFENFRDNMYSSYKEHKLNNKYTSIDRIDNNGNYCKENCKWSTNKEQTNNNRHNHLLTYKEQTLTMAQWAEKLNIKYRPLVNRINNLNWSIEKCFNTPIKNKF